MYNKDRGLYKCLRADHRGAPNTVSSTSAKGANRSRAEIQHFKKTGDWEAENSEVQKGGANNNDVSA